MKKTSFLIFIFIFFGSVCYAQTDTTKKPSDFLISKAKEIIPKDTISIKVPTDSLNYALLYVYRPKSFVGSLVSYPLKISNSLITDSTVYVAKNNSKFVVKLRQEGKTELSARGEFKESVYIDVIFGQKYFLKCGLAPAMLLFMPKLDIINREQGILDFEKVKGGNK